MIRSRLDALAHEGVTIALRPLDTLDGGVRVFSGDQKRMVDNSFTARVIRMEADIRQEIWRTVIGTPISKD
jgi:vacuolar-type H+-ATPase subunit E/Vma4